MAKLYAPLAVAQSVRKSLEPKIPKHALDEKDPSFLSAALHWVVYEHPKEQEPLDLDAFISWMLGNTFLKRSYNGPYSQINGSLLTMMEKMRNGSSFKEVKSFFREHIMVMSILTCWDMHRQAYRFDPDFVTELMQTDAVEVPITVLARLPFRCFYLDTEKIPQMQPSKGFFVYAGLDALDGKPNIGILRILDPYADGKPDIKISILSGRDMEKCGILVRNATGEYCIRFTNQVDALRESTHTADSDLSVFDHYLFVLQAMLYLSSNKPDTMKQPKKRYVYGKKPRTSAKGKLPEPEASVTDVGIRYGAAIRKAKESIKENPGETELVIRNAPKMRKPKASHMRKAHWHHYWTGKGRTKLIVKWVPPTFVSGIGKELPVTIHKVEEGEK